MYTTKYIKYAAAREANRRRGLSKQAGVWTQALGAGLMGQVPYTNSIGTLHGLVSESPTLEELKAMDSDRIKDLIPGVGASRLVRRSNAVRKLLKEDPAAWDFDLTTPLSLVNPLNILAALPAAATAAVTPKVSLEKMHEIENDPHRYLKAMLIPGYATHRDFKRLGLSSRLAKGDPEAIRAEVKRIKDKYNYEDEEE